MSFKTRAPVKFCRVCGDRYRGPGVKCGRPVCQAVKQPYPPRHRIMRALESQQRAQFQPGHA